MSRSAPIGSRHDPACWPGPVVRELAITLGLDPTALHSAPGASGQTWLTAIHALRVRPAAALRVELAAQAAAATALPGT